MEKLLLDFQVLHINKQEYVILEVFFLRPTGMQGLVSYSLLFMLLREELLTIWVLYPLVLIQGL